MKSLLPLALLLFIAFSAAAQSQSSSISPEDLLTSGQAKLDKNDHEGAGRLRSGNPPTTGFSRSLLWPRARPEPTGQIECSRC